jgi:predicted esterase
LGADAPQSSSVGSTSPPGNLRQSVITDVLRHIVAHGRFDDKLPLAWAERAHQWLDKLQVSHRVEIYAMGHELCEQEVVDFRGWLGPVLGL